MAYLDLTPVTVALRGRPEEFEMIRGNLHHLPSRHRFLFENDGTVRLHADCDCSLLALQAEQVDLFKTAFDQWHANYWRAVEINREFARHFLRQRNWRSVCARVLTRIVVHLQASAAQPALVRRPASR